MITLPELALIAGTRAALGAGVGLLLADRLDATQRKAVGWTLVFLSAATTIPLAIEVLGGARMSMNHHALSEGSETAQSNPWNRLIRH
jgi:hypothetical protein